MPDRLLLVGWDAADWTLLQPLMNAGKIPVFKGIVEAGASGSMWCGQPLVPAAQWTSMVTGKRPWQHRVCHQAEAESDGQRAVPVSVAQRQSTALWDILACGGHKPMVVGWPATHGSRGGKLTLVSNRYAEPTAGPGIKPWPPAIAGTYWPEQLGSRLDGLRVSPEDIKADLISLFVPDWRAIDQKRDRRLGQLRVFLAADLSHLAAMMRLLQADDWSLAAIQFPALGAITRLFLPFSTPRYEWVPEQEFQLYKQVLAAAYIMLDRLLGGLVKAAGKETAVVIASSHGVSPQLAPDYLRVGNDESWKSPDGILAMCGPRCSRNRRLLGATIQDVTPTILTWFGLPIGDDMEGRVLMESFATAPEVTRVETWEPKSLRNLERFDAAPDRPVNNSVAARLRLEYDWNFARFCLDAARYEEALPLLEQLFRSFPERAEFSLALFHCQLTLKQAEAAAETLEVLLELVPEGVWSLLPRAELLIAQGERKEARTLVDEIQKLKPADPAAVRRLGMILWRLREWNGLAELAQATLKADAKEPLAWLAQAEASLRLRQPSEAIEAAQRAISLNYFSTQAHLVLARALLAQGKWAEAREAMQVVLRLQPNNRAAATYWRRSGLERSPSGADGG